ncbi:MAG TPA: nucleoside triphosphate pyrophosphatase [Candidatus Saccharimonadales bacterium]|nr:nucleoside triphosphate pyrophosphatase [Candidatus Saccharimonadales bacterium]
MTNTPTRLILASQSPRRRDLLDQMNLKDGYEAIPSGYEEVLDNARSPEEVAQELGYGKALWVAERNPGAWVIGSDTIVTINGMQLGKADNEKHAREMLKLLAGETSTVTSSIVLVNLTYGKDKSKVIKHRISSEECLIHFKPYDQAALDTYISTGDWQDKAGAVGIQSGGDILVESVEGHYDTILGLPTHTLASFLKEISIEATPVELEPPVPRKQ